jgi:hypothetical protein
MGAKYQVFDIFQTPLSSHYPLPLKSDLDLDLDPHWFGSLDKIRIEKKAGSGSALKAMRIQRVTFYHGDLFRSNSLHLQLERMYNTLECPKSFGLDYKLYFLSNYARLFLPLKTIDKAISILTVVFCFGSGLDPNSIGSFSIS